MWLFTKYGFFSAVCARQGKGDYDQPVDTDRLMVRARLKSHLEALKQRVPDLLSPYEIQQFSGTDYAFRIFVPKTVWSEVVTQIIQDMDYDNFQSEVAHYQGREGIPYEHSLHRSIMREK